MGRPYYSRIKRQWHEVTGNRGGSFKKYVLNDYLIEKIGGIDGQALLELGAGNGYFMSLLCQRYSGQTPSRIVISDLSGALLEIAQREFSLAGAEYIQLNVRNEFPFDNESFELVLATMVFNEVSLAGFKSALKESWRILKQNGRLIATITHPQFVERLQKNGKLSQLGHNFWTMPSKGSLRLPVVLRSEKQYISAIKQTGFDFKYESLFPTIEVLNERPGLRYSKDIPLVMVFTCVKKG